jgi:hypothetical protein
MTDKETIDHVLRLFGMLPGEWVVLKRNKRALLVLPRDAEGSLRAMNLYQPQRLQARVMISIMRWGAQLGLQRLMLPAIRYHGPGHTESASLDDLNADAVGILMGSPEHRVQRAIVSYRHNKQWEVAKVSFGPVGAGNLEQEAKVLSELGAISQGVPRLLGLHFAGDATVLRMPYLTGKTIPQSESADALALLENWITNEAPKTIVEFSEWPHIETALSGFEGGQRIIDRMASHYLRPVVCHGDFARWNLLKQTDGSLKVLDWEWGHEGGMPGIDLVHYFLQDARLVARMPAKEAITKTCQILKSPDCAAYLESTGWGIDPLLPIIASLAYKQGAGHQDNREMLETLLNVR